MGRPKKLKLSVGEKYGRWTVLEVRANRKVLCKCSCGTLKEVFDYNLVSYTSYSCGCYKKEELIQRNKDRAFLVKKEAVYVYDKIAKKLVLQKYDTETRFRSKYRINSETGCWEWTSTLSKGRAQIRVAGTYRYASNVSYELYKGEISEGTWVLHKCDNPLCVNPEHLWLGTPRDNVIDAINKGRFKHLENINTFNEARTKRKKS